MARPGKRLLTGETDRILDKIADEAHIIPDRDG
jgi:hypothetical protein